MGQALCTVLLSLKSDNFRFAAGGIFITAGDPQLFRAFLTGYGYRCEQLDSAFSERIMAYLLLHRYCHLHYYLKMLPEASAITTLEQLAATYYSLAG